MVRGTGWVYAFTAPIVRVWPRGHWRDVGQPVRRRNFLEGLYGLAGYSVRFWRKYCRQRQWKRF